MSSEEQTEDLTIRAPKPLEYIPKTFLELVSDCDNFPYYHSQPERYNELVHHYYDLYVSAHPDVVLGWVLPAVALIFQGLVHWKLDEKRRTLTLVTEDNETARSEAMAITTEALRRTERFAVLKGWRDELYPVYGPNKELLFSVERSASCLFGVLTYGCHLTAYTRMNGALQLWVPRRAASKQTYGGMLDNTVAGGIATGEQPLECIIREAGEEASLAESYVREHVKAVGAVSYTHIRDERAGGETGLLQPECQFVYDLELPEDMIPKPSDDEVAGFELMTIEEVKIALEKAEFKPNCALVLLDFFIRHGILTSNDADYIEIVSRIHRILEFPTM